MRSRYTEALNSRIITKRRHPVRELVGRLGERAEKRRPGTQMLVHLGRIQCVCIIRGHDEERKNGAGKRYERHLKERSKPSGGEGERARRLRNQLRMSFDNIIIATENTLVQQP